MICKAVVLVVKFRGVVKGQIHVDHVNHCSFSWLKL